MTTTLWKEKIQKAYANKVPFACYSEPNCNSITICIQKDTTIHTYSQFDEPAFILAPFNAEIDTYGIPLSQCEIITIPLPDKKENKSATKVKENLTARRLHITRVEQAVEAIENGFFQKVVLSRKKEVKLKSFSLEKLLEELFGRYSDAFRYVWYHPATALWCGASPEILLKIGNQEFHTMALAGTKVFHECYEPQWTRKELDEQKIVTEAIQDSLQKVSSIFKISKTYNRRAGNMVHLCTDIKGILRKVQPEIHEFANALHPTPAVCGMPAEVAKPYINKHEGYDREYYTGFMGLVSKSKTKASFFVNLRCMKIEETTATLYVGGGITFESKPEDEWTETQNKLQTMLQVIESMR